MTSARQLVDDVDARVRAARKPSATPLAVEDLTQAQLERYISEKAKHESDFASPYRDVLRAFPSEWWRDVMNEVLAGPDAQGAFEFANAVFAIEPSFFAHTPGLAVRWLGAEHVFGWLQAGGPRVVEQLKATLVDPSASWRWKTAGALALLDVSSLAYIERAFASLTAEEQRAAAWELERAGLEVHAGRLRRLWPSIGYHLHFASGALDRPMDHESWHRATESSAEHAFGGRVEGKHHVLTLDPAPEALGVSINRLVLLIDLDAALDDGSPQFFHHGARGDVRDAPHAAQTPAFRATKVRLAPIPHSELVQSWAETNGTQNLFRLGGHPVFAQSPVYPKCVDCRRKMSHLLSLDSRISLEGPAENGTTSWEWGSGGIANAFWCDGCRVSAWSYACT